METFIQKLVHIQSELKAKKSQYNSFGKYHYRKAEDILEAAKPLLKETGLYLKITDSIVQMGDRFYVKATAIISDGTAAESCDAFAREELEKKGMDGSQVTGSSSSYARKYALNGLFGIDDTADSDGQAPPAQSQGKAPAAPEKLSPDSDNWNTVIGGLKKMEAKKDSWEDIKRKKNFSITPEHEQLLFGLVGWN